MEEQKRLDSLNFEQALAELETIVKKIDTGQESLESSIKSFERGIALKNYCESKLKDARLKIEKITKVENGVASLEDIAL